MIFFEDCLYINFKENENSHENIVKPEVIQKKNKRKGFFKREHNNLNPKDDCNLM